MTPKRSKGLFCITGDGAAPRERRGAAGPVRRTADPMLVTVEDSRRNFHPSEIFSRRFSLTSRREWTEDAAASYALTWVDGQAERAGELGMSELIRVVIADDHAPTRAGVRHALEVDGCVVVAAVADGPKAVASALEHKPDVCVLDIHMPGGGIPAASKITKALPATAIVMLTASRDDEDLFEALRAGACGYLLKDMDPDRLGAALRGVLAGEAALPRALALKVIHQLQSQNQRRFRCSKGTAVARLTSRETEVLELMAEGWSTEKIAGKLFIGKVTVRTHVSNVLKKLRVPDRDSAVRILLSQKD